MNIYVGNLSYEVTDEELRTLFGAFGAVSSAKVIRDQESGYSKGFGFVEMSDDNAARAAIEQLNGTDCRGRALRVNEARPREDRPPRREGGGGGGGGFQRGPRREGGGGGRRF